MPIARSIVRRRGWVALAWLVVLGALVPQARRAAGVLDVGARVEGSEAAAVERMLSGPMATEYSRFAVLVITGAPSPTTPEGAAVLRHIVESLDRMPAVTGTVSWLNRPDTLFLAADGRGFFVAVGLPLGRASDHLVPSLRALTEKLAVAFRPRYPDLTLRWTGEGPLNVDLRGTSSSDIRRAELLALPLTLALLLLAFGTVAAALLPLISGGLAISISLGAAALLARAWPLSILLQSVVTMLGLGLGVDYALLMVSRFREARAAGLDPDAAAEIAVRHAGHTIFLSAATVALGLAVLLALPRNDMRAIAVGGLLVVTASSLLATTLLPGLLAWCGPHIEWGRVRRGGVRDSRPDRWRRWGNWVTTHPWTALAMGGGPLLLLAAQGAGLRTGQPRGNWVPTTMESVRALDDLSAMGRRGVIQVVQVVLELPLGTSVRRSSGWRSLSQLAQALETDSRVARVRSLASLARGAGMGRSVFGFLPDSLMRGLVSADARLARLEVLPKESATSEELDALVRDIRRTGAGHAGLPGARVLVGGTPAFNTDYQDAVAGRFQPVVIFVVTTTLLALFAGFRSILVPVKAVALNLLSVASAFGALTIVFQQGHGGRFFGVAEPVGAVYGSLPVIVFCIVFGLSMDYEVFLMSRVMEARRAGRTDRDAIVESLGTTGRVITSAAAIMLVVFAAFTLGEFLLIKMLGFALAVAVLLDATVVRMLIGPALLQLAGRWNWWPGSVSPGPAGDHGPAS
jgi:RND superfamily putative drug exporter